MAQPVFVISHQRSGTHWTLDTIRHNFKAVNNDFYTYDKIYRAAVIGEPPASWSEFEAALNQPEKYTLVKMHMDPSFGALEIQPEQRAYFQQHFEQAKKIYVYRDGRDVMVSSYYYTQSYAKAPEEYGPEFHQFIRMNNNPDRVPELDGMNRVDYWVHHVEGWLAQDVLPVSYEDLTYRFEDTINRIAAYLEVPAKSGIVEVPLEIDKSLPARLMRKFKSITMNRSYGRSSAVRKRKGVTGDWKQHFSPDDLAFFMEKAQPLMERLSYE